MGLKNAWLESFDRTISPVRCWIVELAEKGITLDIIDDDLQPDRDDMGVSQITREFLFIEHACFTGENAVLGTCDETGDLKTGSSPFRTPFFV